jgi:uncharacterized membrane protein
MKSASALMLAMIFISGCYTVQSKSTKGGSTLKGESFKISAPYFDTKIKQGETRTVTVSLKRGDYFKQDVKLEIKAADGISVEPAQILVKASDKSDVQLMITAHKSAALGEYKVSVMGTPETGEATSTEFNVKVVSP